MRNAALVLSVTSTIWLAVNVFEMPVPAAARLVKALGAVVAPVPPLATAKVPATVTAPLVAVDGVNPVLPKLMVETPSTSVVDIFTKSEPFQATKHFSPEITVTPVVGPEPRITTEPVPALITT